MWANNSIGPRFEPGQNNFVIVFHIIISNRRSNMQVLNIQHLDDPDKKSENQ